MVTNGKIRPYYHPLAIVATYVKHNSWKQGISPFFGEQGETQVDNGKTTTLGW